MLSITFQTGSIAMRRLSLKLQLLIGILLPVVACAQNVVANPGFESYNACPTALSGIAYDPAYSFFPTAKDWGSPLSSGSPDYFNICAPLASGVQVPEGVFGYQQPHNGNAYGGIIAWNGTYQGSSLVYEYSEYLQTKLLQPMQAGQKYCVSFYVSPTIAKNIAFNYIAIDEMGANFSASRPLQTSGNTMSLPYHVSNAKGVYLQDTMGWIRISGIYTAKGGEEWMTLGRFNNNAVPPVSVQVYPSVADPSLGYRTYMYVDDVSVVKIGNKDTVVSVHDTAFCDTNKQLPASISSTGYDGSFSWNTGGTTRSLSVNSTGKYWCIAHADCHVYIDSFYVRYEPSKKLNLGKEAVNCNNQPVTLKSNYTFNSYLWNTGATTPSITVSTPGKYYLTVTDNCKAQTDTVTAYIELPPPPPDVKDTMVCQFVIEPKLLVNGKNLLWYTNIDGIIGNPVQPLIITRDVGKMTVYVTQTLSKCESEKVPLNIDIKYKPRHILADKPVTMCENNIELIGQDLPGLKYKWGTGETDCCIKPDHEGLQRLAITNECGTYLDSMEVKFSICDTCIKVPNAFSPNADGKNDKYGVVVICPVSEYHLMIFSRWGEKVFDTKDVYELWDGSYKGRMCDNGVYMYVIEYRSAATRMNKFLKGNITMFR